LYHAGYAAGASEVESANFPVWQQFIWLSGSPRIWQPDAFYFTIDPIIALLAAIGLAGTWKKQRVFALWLIIGLFFLLIWPTKWPQYLVTISAPLCLAAAEGLQTIFWTPFKEWIARRKARRILREPP
jgi:4-amino-4-deoxy-L-arabinose transferase-like glycosyltransferase